MNHLKEPCNYTDLQITRNLDYLTLQPHMYNFLIILKQKYIYAFFNFSIHNVT